MTHDFDLIGYLEQSISEEERERVKAHIEGCRTCREELEELRKSEAFFGAVLARFPDLFCTDSDELVNLAAGELGPEKKAEIEAHVEACVACREKMALLDEAEKIHVEVPDETGWEPLPQEIRERIGQREKTLRHRLKQALLALKAKGKSDIGDLLDHVDELTERMMAGSPEAAPSYALERDMTLPGRTDLELRIPRSPLAYHFEIGGVLVEGKRERGGIRLKLTRQGEPLRGLKIRVSRDEGEIAVFTDQRGEAFIEEGE